jgi:hypothetical protein
MVFSRVFKHCRPSAIWRRLEIAFRFTERGMSWNSMGLGKTWEAIGFMLKVCACTPSTTRRSSAIKERRKQTLSPRFMGMPDCRMAGSRTSPQALFRPVQHGRPSRVESRSGGYETQTRGADGRSGGSETQRDSGDGGVSYRLPFATLEGRRQNMDSMRTYRCILLVLVLHMRSLIGKRVVINIVSYYLSPVNLAHVECGQNHWLLLLNIFSSFQVIWTVE